MFYAHVHCEYCDKIILKRCRSYHYKSKLCKKIRYEQGKYISFMDRMSHAMELIKDSDKT